MAASNGMLLRKFCLSKHSGSPGFLSNTLSSPAKLSGHGNYRHLWPKKKIFKGIRAKDEKWGGDKLPPFANGSPGVGCPVPFDQQPVNEYKSLAESDLFSWANEDVGKYGLRLLGIGTAFTVFIGWPVTSLSVNPDQELLKCGVGALCGGLLVVIMAAIRMYLGWAYVGNRLFSATVEYEETGWYDGEVWVKPPEVLARDRLLGSYSVKPVLTRVKITLVVLAVSLFSGIVLFISLKNPRLDSSLSVDVNEPFGQRAYSDASSRLFEPEAFTGEVKESQLADYCR